MLDTIKLGVPLTQSQHKKIKAIADKNDCWQWVMLNPSSGELLFRRTKGIATTDGESYHRQLRWDIPHDYTKSECRLMLEFSIPKYWYGHNIHLLYDFVTPLKHLKASLDGQFGLKGKAKLPDVMTWYVSRVDICYAWRFPSQKLVHRFLDSLKRLHFPRKRPIIYDHSILFTGKTYSVKVYEKLPEFKAHDRKELLKGNASLEWVDHCEALAEGVLRFEATLRSQYLRRQSIHTVEDLTRPLTYVEWDCGKVPSEDEEKGFLAGVCAYYLLQKGVDLQAVFDGTFSGEGHPIYDGLTIEAPEMEFDFWGHILNYPGGKTTYRQKDNPTAIAQFMLSKFVGENAGMQRIDEIESKLMETYKPVKAARLVSFWLYVQRFGSAKAKEMFGDRSYYYTKSELKKAGVSLIEPPSGNNVTVINQRFMQDFRMEIPSQFVTNPVDDFRDSSNILNFVPRLSGEDAS